MEATFLIDLEPSLLEDPPSVVSQKANAVATHVSRWISCLCSLSECELGRLLGALVSNQYPHTKKRLLDCVLAAFVFFHRPGMMAVLNALRKVIKQEEVEAGQISRPIYGRGQPPFWAFQQVLGSSVHSLQHEGSPDKKLEFLQTMCRLNEDGCMNSWLLDSLCAVDVAVGKEFMSWLLSCWEDMNSSQCGMDPKKAHMQLMWFAEQPLKSTHRILVALSEALLMPRHFASVKRESYLTMCLGSYLSQPPSEQVLRALHPLLRVDEEADNLLGSFEALLETMLQSTTSPWFFDHILKGGLPLAVDTTTFAHKVLVLTLVRKRHFDALYGKMYPKMKVAGSNRDQVGLNLLVQAMGQLEEGVQLKLVTAWKNIWMQASPPTLLRSMVTAVDIFGQGSESYRKMVEELLLFVFHKQHHGHTSTGDYDAALRTITDTTLFSGITAAPLFRALLRMQLEDMTLTPLSVFLTSSLDYVVTLHERLSKHKAPSDLNGDPPTVIHSTITVLTRALVVDAFLDTEAQKNMLRSMLFRHTAFVKCLMLIANDLKCLCSQENTLLLLQDVFASVSETDNEIRVAYNDLWTITSLQSFYRAIESPFGEVSRLTQSVIVHAMRLEFLSIKDAISYLWQQYQRILRTQPVSVKGAYGTLDRRSRSCLSFVSLWHTLYTHVPNARPLLMASVTHLLFGTPEEAEFHVSPATHVYNLQLLVLFTQQDYSYIEGSLVQKLIPLLTWHSKQDVYTVHCLLHLVEFCQLLVGYGRHLQLILTDEVFRNLIHIYLLPHRPLSNLALSLVTHLVLLPDPLSSTHPDLSLAPDTSPKVTKKKMTEHLISKISSSGVGPTEWIMLRHLSETIRSV
jgi:hypothetical protein